MSRASGALVHAPLPCVAVEFAAARGSIGNVITESSLPRRGATGLEADALVTDDAFPIRPRDRTQRLSSSHFPTPRELGCDGALDEIERMLVDGQTARLAAAPRFARGGHARGSSPISWTRTMHPERASA